MFFDNLVLGVFAKFVDDISKTVGGDIFPVNLKHLKKTENTANWKQSEFLKHSLYLQSTPFKGRTVCGVI